MLNLLFICSVTSGLPIFYFLILFWREGGGGAGELSFTSCFAIENVLKGALLFSRQSHPTVPAHGEVDDIKEVEALSVATG